MRTIWLRAASFAAFALVIGGSGALPAARMPQASPGKTPPKTVTLNGCVERDENAPDQFRLTDTKAKQTYRLTGRNLRAYLGRPVQIDGGVVVRGVKISGGLLPNPNVAAQAGAMDPARAVVAASSGVGPTTNLDDLQEFRVKTIRQSQGSCEPQR